MWPFFADALYESGKRKWQCRTFFFIVRSLPHSRYVYLCELNFYFRLKFRMRNFFFSLSSIGYFQCDNRSWMAYKILVCLKWMNKSPFNYQTLDFWSNDYFLPCNEQFRQWSHTSWMQFIIESSGFITRILCTFVERKKKTTLLFHSRHRNIIPTFYF